MNKDNIAKLIEIVLRIAELSDAKAEQGGERYDLVEELGYGYLAFSGYLRAGIKDIVDLQNDYYNTLQDKYIYKQAEQDMGDFLEEVFGDREITEINEKDKARIKALCDEIRTEWERKEWENGTNKRI